MTALVAPALMRTSISEESGVIRVRIPARRSLFVGVFILVWLCGWAAGEFFALRAVLGLDSSRRQPAGPFLWVWIAGWTFGGAAAMYGWVWNAFGAEVVELDGRTLTLRREPIGFPLQKNYDLLHVRNLRVVPFDGSLWSRSDSSGGLRGGPLAFDYGAKTIRFGAGIDEAEARTVLDSIRVRFPELGA